MKSSAACVKKEPRVRKRSQTGNLRLSFSHCSHSIHTPCMLVSMSILPRTSPFVIVGVMAITSDPLACRKYVACTLTPNPVLRHAKLLAGSVWGYSLSRQRNRMQKKSRGFRHAVGIICPIRSRTCDSHQPDQSTAHTIDDQLWPAMAHLQGSGFPITQVSQTPVAPMHLQPQPLTCLQLYLRGNRFTAQAEHHAFRRRKN